jgi:hypothetical protein
MTDLQAKAFTLRLLHIKFGDFKPCPACNCIPHVNAEKLGSHWMLANDLIFQAECCGYSSAWWTTLRGCASGWNAVVDIVTAMSIDIVPTMRIDEFVEPQYVHE